VREMSKENLAKFYQLAPLHQPEDYAPHLRSVRWKENLLEVQSRLDREDAAGVVGFLNICLEPKTLPTAMVLEALEFCRATFKPFTATRLLSTLDENLLNAGENYLSLVAALREN